MSLVLNRNVGQEVVIGDELIVVRINKVNKGQVTIGLEAPSQISVHRREIFEKNKNLKLLYTKIKYKVIIRLKLSVINKSPSVKINV